MTGPVRITAAQARRMRSAARLYAVQALFQMEAADAGLETVLSEFERHRVGAEIDGATYGAADIEHFRALLTAAVTHQARIDQLTDKALVARWPIDRIDPTLRALFRAAGAELVATDTPPKVTITEYLDVAKAFYPDGKEAKFAELDLSLQHFLTQSDPSFLAEERHEDQRLAPVLQSALQCLLHEISLSDGVTGVTSD